MWTDRPSPPRELAPEAYDASQPPCDPFDGTWEAYDPPPRQRPDIGLVVAFSFCIAAAYSLGAGRAPGVVLLDGLGAAAIGLFLALAIRAVRRFKGV